MAVAAVEIAGRLGSAVRQIIARVHLSLYGMLVIMVAQVLRLRAGLMPAIARYGPPAKLER